MKKIEIIDYFYNKLSDYDLKFGRKELKIKELRIDIFAIGKDNTPFIIEIKRDKNRHIVGQALQYFSLVIMHRKKIENIIGISEINWNDLKILFFAPDFYERDYCVYNSGPLSGRVHFYKFEIIKNNTEIILLDFEYAGPDKNGPLKLSSIFNEYDIIKLKNDYFNYKDTNIRDTYYLENIVSVFEDMRNSLVEYQKIGFYLHWFRTKENINDENLFRIFLSKNHQETESSLNASISIDFLKMKYLMDLN